MPRIAANVTMLFTELAEEARYAAAAAAGFRGVEMLFPYAHPKETVRGWLDASAMEQVLINMPSGDWQGGERGLACLPDRRGEFQDAIGQAIDYARHLDCPRVHVVAGLVPDEATSRRPYGEAYRENVAYAADALAEAGLEATIEPINGKRDAPGFFLQTTIEGREIIAELDRPNLKLQFDAYHVQIMEGDLVETFRACLPVIGHIQIGNPPGRHEPDCGETNYPYFFEAVDASGYDGWVACEYVPRAGTLEGLGWARPYGIGG